MLAYLGQDGSFYDISSEELYGGLIDPSIMTSDQLNQAIYDGVQSYKAMFPPDKGFLRKNLGLIMIGVTAAAALGMVLSPIAASGAITGASEAATTAGATATEAATAGSSALSMAQTAAAKIAASPVIKKGAELIKSIPNMPDKLTKAAEIIGSNKGSLTDTAAGFITGYLQDKANAKLDAKAQAALKEKLEREQDIYKDYLLRQAQEIKAQQSGQKERPIEAVNWATMLAVATPFILLVLGKK